MMRRLWDVRQFGQRYLLEELQKQECILLDAICRACAEDLFDDAFEILGIDSFMGHVATLSVSGLYSVVVGMIDGC
jgi:hypothetical protein